TGAASAPSAAALVGVPTAPTNVIATRNANVQLPTTVSFAPAAANGSPITSYIATCTGTTAGDVRTSTGTSSPILVQPPRSSPRYSCTVGAVNARGRGAESDPSPQVFQGTPVVPSRPVAVSAISLATGATTGSMSVAYQPGDDGGSPITKFTATCASTNGGVTGAT